MTKQEAIRYSIIYVALILLGFFISFKVWWTPGVARFLGLVALVFVFGGFLLLSFSLTRLLVATEVNFSFSTLSNKAHYQSFKKQVGSAVARKVSLIFMLLFFCLGGTTVYCFILFINNYEETQLKEHGVVQTVRIKDIERKGKGSEYAAFDYYLENKVYSNDLTQKDFAIGDSVEIIFSTKDPDIIQWAEDFNSNDD